VAYLIPCHRVIRKVGTPGDYRWGNLRKKALIAWEAANLPAIPRDRTPSPRTAIVLPWPTRSDLGRFRICINGLPIVWWQSMTVSS
jgi:hypothetical protein